MRALRDRLGEAMRLAAHSPGPRIPAWDAERERGDEVREHWRVEADRLLDAARRCGVSIIESVSLA